MRQEEFVEGSEVVKYFELLPDDAEPKQFYNKMLLEKDPAQIAHLQDVLRNYLVPGSIDVNIMTKVDKLNYDATGAVLPAKYADAMSALRGFAESDLSSAVVFSAGLNPRLYQYCAEFSDFYPDQDGQFKKRIILKVSDFRSAMIQGKFLAKKGLWVSEFRIESGLNCGGHAFATDGYLLGPIMDEFKRNRAELTSTLYAMYADALQMKEVTFPNAAPEIRITVQGGIGTSSEQRFLLEHFHMNGTGWGSPFLLVPEATNVDEHTLNELSTAKESDFFLSNASPLGVPFNNFRRSTSEHQRLNRISKDRPGSPCYKKYLAFNTEFGEKPICTASREYQHKKLTQLKENPESTAVMEADEVLEKDCLCEGLSVSAYMVKGMEVPHKLTAVAICPGPNLAYFSGVFTFRQMVDHIYGRINILNGVRRPSMFVKELKMYKDYWLKELNKIVDTQQEKRLKELETFRQNLFLGIRYYFDLIPEMKAESVDYIEQFYNDLKSIHRQLEEVVIPVKIAN